MSSSRVFAGRRASLAVAASLVLATLLPVVRPLVADAALPPLPGSLDPSFGDDGLALVDTGTQWRAVQDVGLVDLGGGAVAAVSATTNELTLQRYDADGDLDQTYGSEHRDEDDPWQVSHFVPQAARMADGGLAVVTGMIEAGNQVSAHLTRFTPAGDLDTAFGDQGHVAVGSSRSARQAIAIQPNGRIIVAIAEYHLTSYSIGVRAYTSTGALDTTFGSGGAAHLVPPPPAGADPLEIEITDMHLGGDGSVSVLAHTSPSYQDFFDRAVVARFSAAGQPATGFGSGGLVSLGAVEPSDWHTPGALAVDGSDVVVAFARDTSAGPIARVVRLGPTGTRLPVTTGGPQQVDLLPAGATTSGVIDLLVRSDGRILAVGDADPDLALQSPMTAVLAPGAPPAGGGAQRIDVRGPGALTSVVETSDGVRAGGRTRFDFDPVAQGWVFHLTASGAVDPTYGSEHGAAPVGERLPELPRPEVVHVRPNGRIVVAGGIDKDGVVLQLLPDGTLDPSFGDGGIARLDIGLAAHLTIDDVAEGPDGSLVVAGTRLPGIDTGSLYLARLEADGTLDPGFADVDHRELTDFVDRPQIGVDANGRVYVAHHEAVLRFTAAGVLDTTFASSGRKVLAPIRAWDIVTTSRGFVVAGVSDAASSTGQEVLVGYRSTGVADTGFGSGGGIARVTPTPTPTTEYAGARLVIAPSGDLVVAGQPDVSQGRWVARFDSLGRPVAGFGGDGVVGIESDASGRHPDLAVMANDVYVDGLRFDAAGTQDDRWTYAMSLDKLPPRAPGGVVDADAEGRLLLATWHEHDFVIQRRRGGHLPPKSAVSIDDQTVVEGTGGAHPIEVTVRLDEPSAVPVHVEVVWEPVEADWDDLRPAPYVPLSVTFEPGDTEETVGMVVRTDDLDEPDTTTAVEVGSVDLGVVGKRAGIVTIVDDDGWDGATPPAPTGVQVTPRRQAVSVRWSPPAGAGHAPTRWYVAVATQQGEYAGAAWVAPDARVASIEGLRAGVPAQVQVVALTRAGWGQASPTVTVTPTALGPAPTRAGEPQGANAGASGDFTNAFNGPVDDDGGSPVRSYTAAAVDPDTGQLTAWRTVPPDVRTYALPGLSDGDHVYFFATTSAGFGQVAGPVPAGPHTFVPVQPPDRVTWVDAIPGDRSVDVWWGPSRNERGTPVQGYAVLVTQDGALKSWVNVGPDVRTHTVTGLDPGTEAEVSVVPYGDSVFGDARPQPERVNPTS